MENKLIYRIIKIYFFFTIVFLITIKYGYFYFNTIIGLFLIFLLLLNRRLKIVEKSSYFIFKIIVYIYVFYIIILPFIVGDFKFINFIYNINKVVPLILLIKFSEYFSIYKIRKEKIKKYCANLFFMGLVITIILFFLGISYIEIGKGIKITTVKETFNMYSEYRVSGFMSHKSRIGIYCILAFTLISQYNNKSIKKYLIYILIFLVSFLSDSLTTFVGLIIVAFIPIIFKNLKIFIKNLKNNQLNIKNFLLISLIIFIFIKGLKIFIEKYDIIFGVRDFSTLGSRTKIWCLALEYIKNNPYGIVKIDGSFKLSNSAIFVNGHNLFLNEFIESGYLGGTLFAIICIYLLFLIENRYLKFTYLIILLVAQIDMMIYNEIPYILFGIISLYILQNEDNIFDLEE